jgi:toxin ParE1/3/4
MLPARALLDAQHEVIESVRRYKLEDPDLGRDFAAKYRAAVTRARTMPQTGHLMVGLPADGDFQVRRFLFERFKHALYVAVLADELVVIAVAHQHQRPMYWRRRLAKVRP